LDDPLSAVDARVGKSIFENAIQLLLQHKTVILVTHQIQFLKSANQIVVIQNGSIQENVSQENVEEFVDSISRSSEKATDIIVPTVDDLQDEPNNENYVQPTYVADDVEIAKLYGWLRNQVLLILKFVTQSTFTLYFTVENLK